MLLAGGQGSRLYALTTRLEARVRSLGQEDTQKKGSATDSNILAWRSPWTEELGRL